MNEPLFNKNVNQNRETFSPFRSLFGMKREKRSVRNPFW